MSSAEWGWCSAEIQSRILSQTALGCVTCCRWENGSLHDPPMETSFSHWNMLLLLQDKNPISHTPDLAHLLSSLGSALLNLNWFEESLGATQESITLYQSLVEKNPASYMPDLACQLSNLGIRLLNLDQHKEALGATQESITLYWSLVEKNPTSYTPDLAHELNNLGIDLSILNQHEESLEVTQESFLLYEALVIKNPAQYSSKWDAACHHLEHCLLCLGWGTKLPDSA